MLIEVDKTGPEQKYMHVNGLQLHYLDWDGDGRPLMLLLHGFMGHAHLWDDFALEFGDQYHVVALDQRGHGRSDWSPDLAYSIDDHFADIRIFVERLAPERLILAGHSMGGRNAMFYAACCPERVERLIVIDSRPWDGTESNQALLESLRHFPIKADTLDEVTEAIRDLYPALPPDVIGRIAVHGYRRTRAGTYVARYDARMSVRTRKSGCTTENLEFLIGNITCPTLIVRGRK